jgi:hypothetical protein
MVTLVTRFGGYVFSSVATVTYFGGFYVSQFLQRFCAVVCECYDGLSCGGHVLLTWPLSLHNRNKPLRHFRDCTICAVYTP